MLSRSAFVFWKVWNLVRRQSGHIIDFAACTCRKRGRCEKFSHLTLLLPMRLPPEMRRMLKLQCETTCRGLSTSFRRFGKLTRVTLENNTFPCGRVINWNQLQADVAAVPGIKKTNATKVLKCDLAELGFCSVLFRANLHRSVPAQYLRIVREPRPHSYIFGEGRPNSCVSQWANILTERRAFATRGNTR